MRKRRDFMVAAVLVLTFAIGVAGCGGAETITELTPQYVQVEFDSDYASGDDPSRIYFEVCRPVTHGDAPVCDRKYPVRTKRISDNEFRFYMSAGWLSDGAVVSVHHTYSSTGGRTTSAGIDADESKKVVALFWGRDVNAKDKKGNTPLHKASEYGRADGVKRLLAAGANVNAKDRDGRTPLHKASEYGHADIVKPLLAAGANVNAEDRDGRIPLHEASEYGHADVVKRLLVTGANVNAGEFGGGTPLHKASKGGSYDVHGHADVVKLLLDAGANVNAREFGGGTPLHEASRYGHADVVKLLLAAGANVNAKNASGVTPLQLAIHYNHADVVELLLKAAGFPTP